MSGVTRMQRELWPDRIKLFACILVAVGHFFMSMTSSGILAETLLCTWFVTTIYYFHVPLFFICSGYLYQKGSSINTFSAWKNNIIKKAIILGIPYFAFSMVTWGLKAIFASSVNNQNSGFLETLFLSPASPYWYLYVLFFVFAVTPTFANKKVAYIGVACALIMKAARIIFAEYSWPYIVSKIAENEIWFVSGIALSVWELPLRWRSQKCVRAAHLCGMFFLVCSVAIMFMDIKAGMVSFLMGIIGCLAVVLAAFNQSDNGTMRKHVAFLSQYTMPVFLMHTIFAAGTRAVLLKMGIDDPLVHIVLGLTASFTGPIAATEIMKWMKIDFLIYPGKLLRKVRVK